VIKILSARQIKEADHYTIEHEPISSIDLMERAATTLRFHPLLASPDLTYYIFCGPGNNGGDGLALARLMLHDNYSHVFIFILADSEKYSEEFKVNEKRLKKIKAANITYLKSADDIVSGKYFERNPTNRNSFKPVIIDALFGSGLNKPLNGLAATLINYLNSQPGVIRIAIDIPSGMYADKSADGVVFKADHTITFQQSKLSFFFPENAESVGKWWVTDIGLDKSFIDNLPCSEYLVEEADVRKILKPRNKFDHKGKFGHAFIYAGNTATMGACILSVKACVRSGAGLTTVFIPKGYSHVLNVSVPESMTKEYGETKTLNVDLSKYNAFALGPGIGRSGKAGKIFLSLLKQIKGPAIIDADGLNILSEEKKGLGLLPENSIITPHPKEFERLAGKTNNWYERHQRQLELSKKYSIYIVLKGAYTCISTPDGNSFFNPTGNPGMAKGGTGDMLTGIIVGLLAQHYSPQDACLLGVYLHGLSADIAVRKKTEYSLLASDMILKIGDAFKKILSGPYDS
jgi:NAD(P)H-hydrate epimerase